MIHLKEFAKELDLSFPEEIFSRRHEIDAKSLSLAIENVQKTISFLHPQVKQSLLDCLQRHNILFRVSGEDSGSKSWYSKYFESIFPGDNSPRRYLQAVPSAPAPSSGIGSPSPSPSPGPVPTPSQLPHSDPPTPSSSTPFFPPAGNDRNLGVPPSENSSSGPGGSNVEPDKKSNSHRSVIIAVAVTASVTFVAVALFFLCCGGFCKPGSKVRRNDERPLLSLSLTDFSAGMHSPRVL